MSSINFQMSHIYETFMNMVYPGSDHKDVLGFLLNVESGFKFQGIKAHEVFNKTKGDLLQALFELRRWPGLPEDELSKLEDMALNASSGSDLYGVSEIGVELIRK